MAENPTEKSTESLDVDSKSAQVVTVLDQYLADLKAGKSPRREEVLAAHPEIAEQLDACLGGIEFIHQSESMIGTDQALGDFRIIREIGRAGWARLRGRAAFTRSARGTQGAAIRQRLRSGGARTIRARSDDRCQFAPHEHRADICRREPSRRQLLRDATH